jgi:putative Holliday junction resolvase
VRLGLAVSDPLGIMAHPLAVVENRDGEAAMREVARLMAEREVTKIVVGLPVRMDGTEGPSAAEARKFAEALRARFQVPVDLWDERLSTAQAERAMLDADMSRAGRKKRRDKVAAQIFLQAYLDAHRGATP